MSTTDCSVELMLVSLSS